MLVSAPFPPSFVMVVVSVPWLSLFLSLQVQRSRASLATRPSLTSRASAGVPGCQGERAMCERQLKVWRATQVAHPGRDIIVELSQSMGRARVRTDGASPTITPGAFIHVQRAGRAMVPIEKLMVHGFPVDLMGIPASTEDCVIASLGGNTMHVKSVALALLVGVLLIDWGSGSRGVGAPASTAPTPPAVFPLRAGKRKRRDAGTKGPARKRSR